MIDSFQPGFQPGYQAIGVAPPVIAWGGPGLRLGTRQEPTPEERRRERERKRRQRREEQRVARAVAAAMVALADQRQKREEEWLLGLVSDDAYTQDMTTLGGI